MDYNYKTKDNIVNYVYALPNIAVYPFHRKSDFVTEIDDFGKFFFNANFNEINSTDTEDINKQNAYDLKKLEEQTGQFINLLIYSDFEDGYKNEAIEFVEQKMHMNEFAVCIWLNKIYMQYTSNRELDKNHIVVSGVLRVIAFLSQSKKYEQVMSGFYAMVRASVLCNDPSEIEAALMVIETWRTKESLSILNEVSQKIIDSKLKEYALQLQKEIASELKEEQIA